VFNTRVEIFGVLTKDYKIYVQVRKSRVQARECGHSTEIDEEILLLTQLYVCASVAARNRRADRTFQPDMSAVLRLEHCVGKKLAHVRFLAKTHLHTFPFNFDPSGIYGSNSRIRNLSSNSVTGNQRNAMSF
jgi:hypothetical protein